MSTTILEREIKLRFSSASEAREAVLAAGALPLYGRRLQEDGIPLPPNQDVARE